jgi:phage recombination protein Bet
VSAVIEKPPVSSSLLARFAGRFGVEPNKMLGTLKATVFKGDVSNEQMLMLLAVADRHGLDPFTREIYAFPDRQNGIVPVVGVDGWSRIINTHQAFDGMEFVDGPANAQGMPDWIECVIHRKDRAHAIRAREYMAECKRDVSPWKSHPRRMLRHKAMIQCARLAFGFGGIYDQDEAERIVEMGPVTETAPAPAVANINARINANRAQATDIHTSDPQTTSDDQRPQPTTDAPSAPDSAPPSVTYATVATALQKAKSADTLELAADLIGSIADETQRAELTAMYEQRKTALAK